MVRLRTSTVIAVGRVARFAGVSDEPKLSREFVMRCLSQECFREIVSRGRRRRQHPGEVRRVHLAFRVVLQRAQELLESLGLRQGNEIRMIGRYGPAGCTDLDQVVISSLQFRHGSHETGQRRDLGEVGGRLLQFICGGTL